MNTQQQVEEIIGEFDNISDETWLVAREYGTLKHQQKAWLRTHLTTLIADMERREKKEHDFAIQQLTGWAECKFGTGNIEDLVISMGLTWEEWKQLTKKGEVDWLNENIRKEITDLLTPTHYQRS